MTRWRHICDNDEAGVIETSRHVGADRDEEGAVLVLALVFLVSVSLLVAGLLTFVGTSLTATGSFTSERSLESAATNAVNFAIQETRGTFASDMVNASPPVPCYGAAQAPQTYGNSTIAVWCSMVWQPFSSNTRIVTYSACSTSNAATASAGSCAAGPLLQAVVTFDDYSVGIIIPSSTPVPCNETNLCGQTMTESSWQWNPSVPAVTSIAPTTAPVTGNQTVTIAGSNFVNGSTVNFVQESGGSPTSDNVVTTIPTSGVTFDGCTGSNNTSCTLTTTAPAVTSGTSYFVTVTTPGGTSQYNTTTDGIFTYTVPAPTVTGISGPNESGSVPEGSIAGGSTVTITGTNFFTTSNFATQVWFCTSSSNCVQASNVEVDSNSSLTASSPPVTAIGNWYVQVTTIGGTGADTQAIFSYSVQVPLIISLSPSSGGPSSNPAVSQITITGSNFLVGSTAVAFCLASSYPAGGGTCGTTVAAASPSVTGPTTLTVTIPTGTHGLTKNAAYYPIITTTVSGTQYASQPYVETADTFTYTG